MIAVAALLTVAAACLTAAAAQRFRDAGQQITAALADPPSYDPDAEACALTRPDDPLEQAWALPAYSRPTRTTEDTR
jgi:class 3 adenylate cyclase